ncbi:MAG: HAD family phosphatase [Deltaproteobacteria bacterium]|nr:HAD family phosphatase [Deltaproteobacteria bacterium]
MRLERAVLFDLDGTLVDTERENVESVVLAARRWHVELDDDLRHFIVGHSWNEIHARMRRECGLEVEMDALIAAAVEEKRALFASKGYEALPGAVALVRRLHGRAGLAVVSGSSCVEVRETIAGIGLADCFAHLLGAEAYSRGKPHPEPYLTAMRLLGVEPRRSVIIEDSEPGIRAGRATGAKVIAVRRANFMGYDQSAADVVVDTLEQVSDELLDRLWQR